MWHRLIGFVALLSLAGPALAERLQFDHRLVPALFQVLESGNDAMVAFDGKNPAYLVDVIAVRGKSAKDWTEAMVIVARKPGKVVRTADDWYGELRAEGERRCSSTFTELARDAISVTFERRSTGCPAKYPPFALYRVVQGKSSLFLLSVLSREELSLQSRGEWLSLLASARLD